MSKISCTKDFVDKAVSIHGQKPLRKKNNQKC